MTLMSPEFNKIIRQNIQDESTYRAICELIEHGESSIANQTNYLKRLHHLTTSQYVSLDALFLAYLKAGCEALGIEQGHIRQIEHDTAYTQAILPQTSNQSLTIPLKQLMCQYVVEDYRTRAIHDCRRIQSLPQSNIDCYIGTPLVIDNRIWGTISFSSSQAKDLSFTESEIEFVELMAENISRAIAQTNYQRKLNKQHYNLIFENIDTPILMYDVDSYAIIEANPAATAFYGYDREEFSDLSLVDINMLPPSDIEAKIKGSRAKGRPSVHFPHRLKGGEIREVEVYTNEIQIDNRHIRFSIIYDYSERHESEEALKHSEANLRAVFDNASHAMYFVDDTANIVAMNPAATQLNDLVDNKTSSQSDTLHYYYVKADRYLVSDYIALALQGQTISYESFIRATNNQPLYIYYRYVPVKTPDDQIIGVCVTGQDITSLKLSQEELARERNILRTLIDNVPDSIWIKDADARLLNANQAYMDLAQVSSLEDIIGKTVLEIFPRYADQYYADDMEALTSGKVIHKEQPSQLSNDKIRLSDITKIPLWNEHDQIIGLVGVGRDITVQREMENALHHRDEILNTINDAAQRFLKDGNWRDRVAEILGQLGKSLKLERVYLKRNVEDTSSLGASYDYEWVAEGIPKYASYPETHITRWSDMLRRGELVYGHIDDMLPDEQEILLARDVRSFAMAPVLVNARWWGSIGFDAIHSEREWHPIELEAIVTAASTLGAAIQREQIEQGLRDNEEKFNQLVTHIPEAFWIFDLARQELVYANNNYETIFGISLEDRQRDINLFLEQVHPDDRALAIYSLERQSQGKISDYEARFIEDNGGFRWIRIRIYPIQNEDHNIYRVAGIASDITEQKQVEAVRLEMLAQQERIGILSSFFRDASHEFKTPLSIINTSVYILGKTEDANTRQTHYDLIREQVRDVSDLVETLVLMSRLDSRAELTFSPLNINSILRQIDLKIHESYPERADDFYITIDESLPLILGHVNYISQAFINLIDNAVRYSSLGEPIYLRTYHNDKYVIMEVEDTGIGISESELPEIFKRFYRGDEAHSTRGFGLGLPIAQRIAQRHGGDVLVESELHRGSAFRILFPMIQVLG